MWQLFIWPALLVSYTVWEQHWFRQHVAAPTGGLDFMGFRLAMTSFWLWDIILKVSLGLYTVSVMVWIIHQRQKKLPLKYTLVFLLGPLSLITTFCRMRRVSIFEK